MYDKQKDLSKKLSRANEMLAMIQSQGVRVMGHVGGEQEEEADLRDLRMVAKTHLLSLLRFDVLDENVLTLISHPGYKIVIGQILGQEIPASTDPNFPKVFNNAFFQLQFTDRLLSYMSWGESARYTGSCTCSCSTTK